MARNHNWKLSWPGNYCLDCGMDDLFERGEDLEGRDSFIDCPCKDGSACLGTGVQLNPEFVMPPCPCPCPGGETDGV